MIFEDRHHAGKELVKALKPYNKAPNTLVLGLPRGGVVVAYEVADALKLPLDIICPRKVGAPYNSELALGAVTHTGEGFYNEELILELGVSQKYLQSEIENQKKISAQRMKLYRANRPPLNLEGLNVLLVDDGLATGATMKAAIISAKAQNAAKVIAAIPVGPPHTLDEISTMADEVVCLSAPTHFYAVGQFYNNFVGTEDEEVLDLLSKIPYKPNTR